MSTSSFDPFSFLMKVSPALLEQYAKRHKVKLNVNPSEGEEYADAVYKRLESLLDEEKGVFWTDIDDIDVMSTERGCKYLVNVARRKSEYFDEEALEKLQNLQERSIYFYLNHYDLFYETYDLHNVDMKGGWRSRKTEPIPVKNISKSILALENALKELYQEEHRSGKLKVKQVDKKDRMLFIVYVEDLPVSDMAFKGDTLKPKNPRNPVRMAYFRYRPKEGVIEVRAGGGVTRIKKLQDLFIEYFLGGDPKKHRNKVRYNFDKIRDLKSLKFPTETKDDVESVTLKGLRLIHNENNTRVSIDVPAEPNRQGVLPMQDKLKEMNINLEEFEVKQFKILVLFKEVPQERQQRVTVAISYPNICDLKDRDIDNTVRRLLKKWNLDNF